MFKKKKKGTELEDLVAYVYQSLLELNDYPSLVSKHVNINGLNGPSGEIDVYYEFNHLNLVYRVAIECKDWATPIPAEEVRIFHTKVQNLNNIAGVMIVRNGYQSGALDYAKRNGIILMEIADLPSINQLLAGKIQKLFLPDKKVIGEPFWTLMEFVDGKVTGTYYSIRNTETIPLLLSKKTADVFLEKLPDKERWCVRGITQKQLEALIGLAEVFHWKLGFCPIPFEQEGIAVIDIDLKTIKEHYIWD